MHQGVRRGEDWRYRWIAISFLFTSLFLNRADMVGGTIWKIAKETEEIIYAVSYNQKKERHLNGTVLETLTKPRFVTRGIVSSAVAQCLLIVFSSLILSTRSTTTLLVVIATDSLCITS
jgi:hypothetical protein